MSEIMAEVLHEPAHEPPAGFPYAPEGWTPDVAMETARKEGMEAITDDHWELIRALQEYYAKHQQRTIRVRELAFALDEKFHPQGGLKYLYSIMSGGPVAQGCRLAGLPMPHGAVDKSFGSVM